MRTNLCNGVRRVVLFLQICRVSLLHRGFCNVYAVQQVGWITFTNVQSFDAGLASINKLTERNSSFRWCRVRCWSAVFWSRLRLVIGVKVQCPILGHRGGANLLFVGTWAGSEQIPGSFTLPTKDDRNFMSGCCTNNHSSSFPHFCSLSININEIHNNYCDCHCITVECTRVRSVRRYIELTKIQ